MIWEEAARVAGMLYVIWVVSAYPLLDFAIIAIGGLVLWKLRVPVPRS